MMIIGLSINILIPLFYAAEKGILLVAKKGTSFSYFIAENYLDAILFYL